MGRIAAKAEPLVGTVLASDAVVHAGQTRESECHPVVPVVTPGATAVEADVPGAGGEGSKRHCAGGSRQVGGAPIKGRGSGILT